MLDELFQKQGTKICSLKYLLDYFSALSSIICVFRLR